MKVRKKNSAARRRQRGSDAVLSHNGIIIVHVDSCGDVRHGAMSWKSLLGHDPSPRTMAAILDIPHNWAFTVNLMWLDKLHDLQITWLTVPAGRYKAENIDGYVERKVWEARQGINPGWSFLGYAWIASPSGMVFDTECAERILDSVNAYQAAFERRRLVRALAT